MTGIFDSGVGGLTALREYRRICPSADICYFADRKNAPYGNKSREELMRLVGRDIEIMKENYMIVVTDIGIIGQWFIYGLIWIILYVFMVFNIVIRYRKKIPLYIRLFVIGTFINSAWIFPYRREYEFFIWTVVLYISSIYIYQYDYKNIRKNL